MRNVYRTKKTFLTFGIVFLALLIFYILLNHFLSLNNSNNKILSEFGFEDVSVEDLVVGLDSGEYHKPLLRASITGSNLKLTEGDKTADIKIDNNKFYLSFAPYINKTHPCSMHNLITCRSELVNELFDVKIYNNKEEVIFDQTVQSMTNGFIGLWLPKDITGTLIVSYQGLTAQANISTFANSNTCLTTPLKLN